MRALEIYECVWLACAIDGEGSISLTVPHHHSKWQVRPRLTVSNTCAAFCKRVLELTEIGRVTITDQRGNRKPCFQWEVGKQSEIYALLTQILPHLIIKKEQARLVLDFIEIRRKVKRTLYKFGESTYSQEEFEMVKKIRTMNSVKGRRFAFENLTVGVK